MTVAAVERACQSEPGVMTSVMSGPSSDGPGVAGGAAMPSTSQPSPQDFENAYKKVMAAGADTILCITISSGLSGTFQSANVAKANVSVPVTVFDSRAASIGLGDMVKKAAHLRDSGASLEQITKALEHIRDTNFVLFTVDTLDFLQKKDYWASTFGPPPIDDKYLDLYLLYLHDVLNSTLEITTTKIETPKTVGYPKQI